MRAFSLQNTSSNFIDNRESTEEEKQRFIEMIPKKEVKKKNYEKHARQVE